MKTFMIMHSRGNSHVLDIVTFYWRHELLHIPPLRPGDNLRVGVAYRGE